MSLVEHARRELQRIGEDQDVIDYMVGVVAKFAEFGHSGGSAMIMIPRLTALFRQEPLSPLTSDPDEWENRSVQIGHPFWQNQRDPRAFSEDGGKTWWIIGDDEVTVKFADQGAAAWFRDSVRRRGEVILETDDAGVRARAKIL